MRYRKFISMMVCLLSFCSFSAFSSDKDVVIVSAQRIPSKEVNSGENVVVYTQDDLQKISARDLGEVLKRIPGVDVSVRSGFGQATAVTMHGSASRQVLVMVDGIPFNTQLSGQANPAKIPVEHIDRVEVIKGPSSSVWGSSLGGVVNVITKDVGTTAIPQGEIRNSFAEFKTKKHSFEINGAAGDFGYMTTGSYFESDGILSATESREIKTYTKVAHPLGDAANVTASFGYSGAQTQFGGLSSTVTNQPYTSRYGKVGLDVDQIDYAYEVAYKYHDQDITSDTFSRSTGALLSATVSHDLYQGISLNSRHYFRDEDVLSWGADFDYHKLKSNNYLSNAKSNATQAPYFNYTLVLDQWDVIPGARYDHNQHFGEQVSPSLAAVYHFEDEANSLFRIKTSQAFNAPPLLWIFNYDPIFLVGPNRDLKAERGIVYEIGGQTKVFDKVGVDLSLYRSDIKDAISLVFNSQSGLFVQDNFKKFVNQGAELLLDYQINDEWMIYGAGAFNDPRDAQTKRLVRDSDVTRQSFKLGGQYQNIHGFSVNLSGAYNRWLSSPSLKANDRKMILDARFVQEFYDMQNVADLELFLNIHNLTNSKYWSNISFPLAERYFEGGLAVKF